MNLSPETSKPVVLVADDDADDRLLLSVAISGEFTGCELRFVENGEELMEYLLRRNAYAQTDPPKPGLILLDLNMPKKDGRQALIEIRSDDTLRDIPVVVWTTSRVEDDKLFCAEAGASDYVSKPNNFIDLETAVKGIIKSWLRVAI